MTTAGARRRSLRQIIRIDEALCNGCGDCVPACPEGALRIVDGKAKLVKELYCDGLGACLGHCPTGALTIEDREADPYDEAAVQAHLAAAGDAAAREHHAAHAGQAAPTAPSPPPQAHVGHFHPPFGMGGCPGSALRQFARRAPAVAAGADAGAVEESVLTQWPIQLALVPPNAPFFREAELLLAADCVPFAFPGFHRRLLGGKALAVGCPKLDDGDFYREKLAEIFRHGGVKKVTVVRMEVPCCGGLVWLAQEALKLAGKETEIPFAEIVVGIDGEVRS